MDDTSSPAVRGLFLTLNAKDLATLEKVTVSTIVVVSAQGKNDGMPFYVLRQTGTCNVGIGTLDG